MVSRLAPAFAVFVAVGTLLGFGGSFMDSRWETKAHAQESSAAQAAALAATRAECELRLEQSLGKVRVEMAEIRGAVARVDDRSARLDAMLQRIAEHLRVPPPTPGFVPLYAPPAPRSP